jgi:hypothetical protein
VVGQAGDEFAGVEEDQVSGQGVFEGHVRQGEPPLLGGAGDGDSRGSVGRLGEAGAVEPALDDAYQQARRASDSEPMRGWP